MCWSGYYSKWDEGMRTGLKKVQLMLPRYVVERLKTVAKRRSRAEMSRVPISVVALDAILTAYFKSNKRRGK